MDEPLWLEETRGYIDLGMLQEATGCLDALPLSKQRSAEAMEMRIIISLNQKDLEGALKLSRELCDSYPENHAGFIQGAYCLHELGRTTEAQEHLQNGPTSLRREPVYFYNLGCYDLSLGKKDAAMAWLNRAFEMSPGHLEKAISDPDLEPLKELLQKRANG